MIVSQMNARQAQLADIAIFHMEEAVRSLARAKRDKPVRNARGCYCQLQAAVEVLEKLQDALHGVIDE